ncbi:hypothetical protein [Streptomyces sp. NBC_01563]|uniref:hypothetical protein n=1 Tax=Streptomyces sp. NBC_01563 TaxID=2975880 RepID=UPI00386D1CD9
MQQIPQEIVQGMTQEIPGPRIRRPFSRVAVLEAEGIRPKHGERWHPETGRRMLTHEAPHTPRRR